MEEDVALGDEVDEQGGVFAGQDVAHGAEGGDEEVVVGATHGVSDDLESANLLSEEVDDGLLPVVLICQMAQCP